jgi:tetraacyldisaccharide 4'-kinase
MTSNESRFRQIMDGSDRSAPAGFLRAAAACAEPFYSTIMRARNAFYDSGILASHSLGRPTISVGNITTGGTGKTPVVQWLAKKFAAANQHPAILLRGYKATSGGLSDEQVLLQSTGSPVIADPDRVRAAARALADHPQTTLFILDDGMQHRRARRDFELTLINAADPFGYERVFPRGLLRESLAGLSRADGFLITHSEEVDAESLAKISATIRGYNSSAPIFHCDHVLNAGFTGKKYYAFCGIGSPQSFFNGLKNLGGIEVGSRVLDDHYDYSESDAAEINSVALAAQAGVLITTAKDWVKLERFAERFTLPVARPDLILRFHPGDEERLFTVIREKLKV